jgi:hypothetical protein
MILFPQLFCSARIYQVSKKKKMITLRLYVGYQHWIIVNTVLQDKDRQSAWETIIILYLKLNEEALL